MELFYSLPLSKTATNGASWATLEARFPELQVFANVTLSSYQTQTPERFAPFQSSWAEAYIVTPQTPMTHVGAWSWPSQRDNTVYLLTDRMTFYLQVNNGANNNPPTTASAVANIHNLTASAGLNFNKAIKQTHLAIYGEDGTVIGTRTSVQLEGGAEFDEEETGEKLLLEAEAVSGLHRDSLQVTAFHPRDVAHSPHFRVDPSTGRPEPLNTAAADRHPFRG